MRTHLKRSSKHVKRDTLPILQWLRDRMLGRKTETGLRFEWEISERTQPDPDLPDGPSHKLFGNYYYLRDARRLVDSPKLIMGPNEMKNLPPPVNSETAISKGSTRAEIRPGALYDPPVSEKEPINDYKISKIK